MKETLSLSWDSHQNNICNGLSQLQQRGEFVDMTLAADGHHVKVHQMVLSLASPYIKELISTAQCPHPVIFLNNISYKTLSAILEYAYTGQTVIHKETLPDLIAAGKALHIQGLKEMVLQKDLNQTQRDEAERNTSDIILQHDSKTENDLQPMCRIFVNSDNNDDDHHDQTMEIEESIELKDLTDTESCKISNVIINNKSSGSIKNREFALSGNMQYSISNQGNLQVIVNRFIYNLKYVQKNHNRYWRCVDYAYKKCPANVYTNDKNEVVKRRSTHNHPFHDQKIMKKLRMNVIFGAYNEAEDLVHRKKAADDVEIVPCSQSQLSDTE